MKKKIYSRFSILFALTFLFPTGLISTVQADTKAVGGVVYNYTVSNGEAMILNAEKTVRNLVIPDKLGGYPVTSIDENAFLWDKTIETVTISDNVKIIKDQAFPGCPNLRTVVLGKGVVELKKHCFYDCTALTEVILSYGLKAIGESAFNNCTSLKSIDIPYGVETINGWAFVWSGLTEVSIPGSVKFIGRDAFAYCFSLRSVTLENGIEEMVERAFANCPLLKSIVIPDSMKTLGIKAFCYDNALESITIGANITEIGARTFTKCFALKKIIIRDGLKQLDGFEDDPCLREIHIPASVTEIGLIAATHYTTVEPDCMIVYGKSGSYAERWSKLEMSMYLETAPLSGDIRSYAFGIHCYRKGDITARFSSKTPG